MKHIEIRGLKPDGRGILIPASQNVEAKTGVRCTRIIKRSFIICELTVLIQRNFPGFNLVPKANRQLVTATGLKGHSNMTNHMQDFRA